MAAFRAEAATVRRNIILPPKTPRRAAKTALLQGVTAVLDAAIMDSGETDLRQGILTAVYNHDIEAFEIRWDIAK
ncbi:hypothetical protein [Arthrobacter sp. ISL-95]|uniref:hypothetical protein n=1 Tax=Arthrobacter sp. ISL-95 TaxID=2819116 RepID=UPI001BE6C410|nr:hypothetical protein [Arthrobacter sp. ISL-95]MBT2587976.1 hypothetical protein [Arthrobacter sp. ISL-95]